ncbi:hypothetical protein F0P96_12325 [Hymenobacter busanensis]|uniref:Uncharacterized protein n=1 Tax=Hymenobacter busanensis TaxID=2607656 RepID=A0A7L4ZWM7_9BACT|nr:hypothetical protein [Hymenobacter busanensis]KAA9332260.1 hypothetical protein F0P96_12325 [Hymenobacter busanensis]QHJ07403.1 hypothetical protein GUY19_08950 [Hymenobacter busanensis]
MKKSAHISAILSTRSYLKQPLYDLIYEWEEDLAQALSVPILNAIPTYRKALYNPYARKAIMRVGKQYLDKWNNTLEAIRPQRSNEGYNFVYELGVNYEPNFSTSAKAIPAFIDFWKHTDLDAFYENYKRCKIVLISSLETYEFLKAQNCPLNIAHFPLCLSDRYRLEEDTVYEKKYDILLAGKLNIRTNQVLRNYLDEFVSKYKDVEFLCQQEINGEFYYSSNKKGIIGKFHSRPEYIKLLRASKVSFYSTPGIDGGEKRTGGFNPVTPRYLELLSAQCMLLGKYPDNEETAFYELPRVCPNVESYAVFENTLLGYLNQSNPDFSVHREILDKHYTSRRAELLQDILSNF